jgi:serine/threonine protein kinase
VASSPGEDAGDGEDDSVASIYMVFEYCEYDLQGLLAASKVDASVRLTAHHVRSYAYQLLEGLAFMHTNRFLHRDIKGCNILVGANNVLKIADWGLARPENDSIKKYTPNLITLGFRPLEILLGCAKYDTSADIWSAGCILGELLLRSPMFPVYPNQSEAEHVQHIFNVVGTPKLSSEPGTPALAADLDYRYDVWPGIAQACPLWNKAFAAGALKDPKPRLLQAKFGGNAHEARGGGRPPKVTLQHVSPLAVDLLEKLLHLDPSKRLGAKEALNHEYFWNKADGEVKRPEQ